MGFSDIVVFAIDPVSINVEFVSATGGADG